jgi:hypothetical protein
MTTTKYISSDSPAWWQQSPLTQTNAPSKSYLKLTGPQKLDGKTHVTNHPIFSERGDNGTHSMEKFDPMSGTSKHLPAVPNKLPMADTLDLSRIDNPRQRLLDPGSFNSRHRDTLEKSHRAFFRSKGAMETYLEDAHG